MGQSLVGDFTRHICVTQEINRSLGFLPAALAEGQGDRPFVAVVKSREELLRWLREPSSDVQWLQVEGVIGDADAWAAAAQGDIDVPVDVVLAAPASEFADLYRLVEITRGLARSESNAP